MPGVHDARNLEEIRHRNACSERGLTTGHSFGTFVLDAKDPAGAADRPQIAALTAPHRGIRAETPSRIPQTAPFSPAGWFSAGNQRPRVYVHSGDTETTVVRKPLPLQGVPEPIRKEPGLRHQSALVFGGRVLAVIDQLVGNVADTRRFFSNDSRTSLPCVLDPSLSILPHHPRPRGDGSGDPGGALR